jgi:sirohydrochlorin ferrochelatase
MAWTKAPCLHGICTTFAFGYSTGNFTRGQVALAPLAHVFVRGGHVAEDIPRQVAAVQMSFPQVKIELLQPIGEHHRVKKLFWEIACNYVRTELQD